MKSRKYQALGFILLDLLYYSLDIGNLGFIFGIFMFVVILAMYLVFFIWGGRTYRNKFMDGKMNYGKAILFCLAMVAVYVIVMFVYQLIFYYLFDPTRAATEMQKSIQMIQENANIPDEKKEEIISRISENTSPGKIVIRNIFANMIFGTVFAAIAALFVRKREKISEVF